MMHQRFSLCHLHFLCFLLPLNIYNVFSIFFPVDKSEKEELCLIMIHISELCYITMGFRSFVLYFLMLITFPSNLTPVECSCLVQSLVVSTNNGNIYGVFFLLAGKDIVFLSEC